MPIRWTNIILLKPFSVFSQAGLLSLMASIVVILFCIPIVLSFFIPIVWDDIFYPITASRAGYDGWNTAVGLVQCGDTYLTKVPATLLPGRIVSWWIHAITNNFYTMRIITISILIGWISYTVWFFKRCLLPNQPILHILAGIIGFVGVGTLPFSMLMNRPEMAMICVVTFYASLPFILISKKAPSLKIVILVAFLFMFVTSWFLSAHPKALLYIPLILVSAAWILVWHKAIGSVLLSLVALSIYQSWGNYWQLKLSCPGSIEGLNKVRRQAVLPEQWLHNSDRFWYQIKENILHIKSYIQGTVFFEKDILSKSIQDNLEVFLFPVVSIIFFLAIIFFIISTTAALCKTTQRNEYIYAGSAVSFSLLVAALSQAVLQTAKKFYNFSLIWISLLLAGVILHFAITHWREHTAWEKSFFKRCCVGIFCLNIVSQCIVLFIYIPAYAYLLKSAPENGIINSWLHTVSPLDFEKRQERILNATKDCNIATDQSSQHIVIDTFTYMALKKTYQPLNIYFELREFDEPGVFFTFLKHWDSYGLVTMCGTLPKKIKPLAKAYGDICCMSKEQIDYAP